jgi:hypothetical protein
MAKKPDTGSGAPIQDAPKTPNNTTSQTPQAKPTGHVEQEPKPGTLGGSAGALYGTSYEDYKRFLQNAAAQSVGTLGQGRLSKFSFEDYQRMVTAAGPTPGSLMELAAKLYPPVPEKSSAQAQADLVLDSVWLLKERHSRIKSQTALVDQRIHQFEDWVATVPGRVETEIWVDDPDAGDVPAVSLHLDRVGKKWVVNYSVSWNGEYDASDRRPLTEAGIRFKVSMLSQLPKLIESMVDSQDKLSRDIEKATKQFDEFAALTMRPAVSKEGA